MALDILLGLQWGDEGKGKIVDVFSHKYDLVARFQGGPNAGHSLEFDGKKVVLHLIPSGIFRDGTQNLIGSGVVLDPITLLHEIEEIEKLGVTVKGKLFISEKTHLILPTHRALDKASEIARGKEKIGSTLKGIAPTYMDKIGRNGLRIGNIFQKDFDKKYKKLKNKHLELIESFLKGKKLDFDIATEEKKWFEAISQLKTYNIVNGEYFVNEALANGKEVLAEGAQGTLLDINFGTYPYVTSSNTIAAGVSIGLGIAPKRINKVYGIFKAYTTRVGRGPFPTELNDETGQKLRDLGKEYGATTGRPRRCGWLDLVALKYAVMINGVTDLVITKADVLSNMPEIKIGTAYKVDDNYIEQVPFDMEDITSIKYEVFPSWEDLTGITSFADLPSKFKDYLTYIENKVNVAVDIISTGPDRKQIIFK